MIKIEPRQIGGALFFRLSGGAGPVRTEPTGIAVLTLRHALDKSLVERVRHRHAARECEQAIKDAIGAGRDASQHRAALAKLDDTAEVISAEVDHLIALIEDVRVAAVKHHTAPIVATATAAVAAHIEEFSIPEELQ